MPEQFEHLRGTEFEKAALRYSEVIESYDSLGAAIPGYLKIEGYYLHALNNALGRVKELEAVNEKMTIKIIELEAANVEKAAEILAERYGLEATDDEN